MDDHPRRPAPELCALLQAVKRRNREALARAEAPKTANRRALRRVLQQLMDS